MDGVQPESDLSQHVSHLELYELVLSQRPAKLLALQGVLSSLVEAEFCSAHRSPGDSKTSLVEAAEGSLEALDVEHIFLGDLDVVKHDHTSRRRPQRVLALNLRRLDARHRVLLEDKTTDIASFILGPNDEDVSVGRVCDPSLAPVENEVITLVNCLCRHLAGVGTSIWLRETETPDELSRGELGDQAVLHRLICVGVNGEHDEGRLYGECRPIATIDILNRSVDQT